MNAINECKKGKSKCQEGNTANQFKWNGSIMLSLTQKKSMMIGEYMGVSKRSKNLCKT